MPMTTNAAILRIFFASLSIAVLASCALRAAPQPQRTYVRVTPAELLSTMERVFADAGFAIAQRDPVRGSLQTAWKQAAVDSGLERRMYSAWIDTEALHRRHMLFLTVVAESKPSASAPWTSRDVLAETDPEAVKLLQAIDRAVLDRGGAYERTRGLRR